VLKVVNTGDRPIQVGSHYHFFETNDALRFERKGGVRLPPPTSPPARRCASSRGRTHRGAGGARRRPEGLRLHGKVMGALE